MAEEVEVSTETNAENPEDPENPDDEEDNEEDDKDDKGDNEVEDPEWQEETSVQVFVDRDLQARLSRSILHAIFASET